MAHFAEINSDNVVQRVIVVNNDILLDSENNEVEQLGIDFCKSLYGQDTNWVQASYNGNIRKQYPHTGYIYDSTKDKFIEPQPFPSWTLNPNDEWIPPVTIPSGEGVHEWNEESLTWDTTT